MKLKGKWFLVKEPRTKKGQQIICTYLMKGRYQFLNNPYFDNMNVMEVVIAGDIELVCKANIIIFCLIMHV